MTAPAARSHRLVTRRSAVAALAALEPSHLTLEGYINTRVFVEALKRTGRSPRVSASWS